MTSLLLLKSMLYANVLQKSKKKKKVKLKKLVSKSKKLNLSTCRICNDGKGDIPIFTNSLQPHIPEEIKHFAGVEISKTDNLPKHMCQSCLDLLNGCIMFRDMCQRSNRALVELSIKKEISFSTNNKQKDYLNHDNEPLVNSDEDTYNVPSPEYSDHIPSPDFSDGSELWGCTICNSEFWSLKSYNRHLYECKKQIPDQKPTGEQNKRNKTFLCDICGKTAKSNANLLVHMGIHDNVFPYKCDACPYQGRTMDLLKVHRRTHLADKPCKCPHCGKATTTSSNLAKHMRHVHSTTRPFKCSYCDKAFSYQHDMKRHIKDIHLRQGTVECDVCYKRFNTKKILQGHRWKIHKIKGERQGRLPSYLQYQTEENDNNMNNCDLNYQHA